MLPSYKRLVFVRISVISTQNAFGIDISLLLNGHPPHFISRQFDRFFRLNSATSAVNQDDELGYRRLHQTLLYQKTRRQIRVCKTDDRSCGNCLQYYKPRCGTTRSCIHITCSIVNNLLAFQNSSIDGGEPITPSLSYLCTTFRSD